MDEEIKSLESNHTFQLTLLPDDQPLVVSKWVYAINQEPKKKKKYKARFCAKGFKQVENVNYTETFSPSAKLSSIRVLLQLSTNSNLQFLHQLDAKLDHTIYVIEPEGYQKISDKGVKLVMKLKKALYGLKQAGKMWYNLLTDIIIVM